MKWTLEREKRVRDLIGENIHARQVAAIMGVSKSAIIGLCRRKGITILNGHDGNPKVGSTNKKRVKTARISIEDAQPDPIKAKQAQSYPEPVKASSEDGRCKFPILDDGQTWVGMVDGHKKNKTKVGNPGFHFCPNKKTDQSYCDSHQDTCYNPEYRKSRVTA